MTNLGIGLFSWYIIALYTVYLEYSVRRSLPLSLFIIGEIVNIGCLIFIANAIQKKKANLPYLILGLLIILWYCYYTFIDASGINGSFWVSIWYVLIDVLTYLYVALYLIENPLLMNMRRAYSQMNKTVANYIELIIWLKKDK